MVAHYASSRVPRFASLIEFMRARKMCRLYQPHFSTIQIGFKRQRSHTLGTHSLIQTRIQTRTRFDERPGFYMNVHIH